MKATPGHEHDLPAKEQATVTKVQLLSALEQIEILYELIDTLKLELRSEQQKLQELERELVCTNQELFTVSSLEQISLARAKALARAIWQTNKSTSDSLAAI